MAYEFLLDEGSDDFKSEREVTAEVPPAEVVPEADAVSSEHFPPVVPSHSDVPASLCDVPRWVCWKYEERDGKKTKVPYNPITGARASSTDSATWSSLECVLGACEADASYAGVGVVLGGGYGGVDLDGSVDEAGRIKPWAQAILKDLDSYAEFSPSGRGIKVFLLGAAEQAGRRGKVEDGQVEVYSTGRYFTVTGMHVEGTPCDLQPRGKQLEDLIESLFKAERAQTETQPSAASSQDVQQNLPDDELLGLMFGSKSGEAIKKLFNGDTTGYPSESEADAALLAHLCWWTDHNAGQMGRLFSRSELGKRGKWTGRPDYRERSIKNALETTQGSYDPPPPWMDGRTFVPEAAARTYLKRTGRLLCYGFDPERGSGQLMAYGNGVWKPAVDLEREIFAMLGADARKNRVEEVVYALEQTVPRRSWWDWNAEPHLINCTNGMLGPAALELREHAPEYWSTFQMPHPWDPNAEDQTMDGYLHGVLPDAEVREVFLEQVGILLQPGGQTGRLLVLEGTPGTGKTTMLETVLALVGERAATQVPLQDLAGNRFASALLENKLVGWFDDLPAYFMDDVSHIKALTGGMSSLKVERKGLDSYEAPLYARLVYSCNSMPHAREYTGAWYSRLLLIPFDQVFRGTAHEDVHMADKLKTPVSQARLLRLVAEALQRRLQAGPLHEPALLTARLQRYQCANDTVRAFCADRLFEVPKARVRTVDVFGAYQTWCDAEGVKPVSRRALNDRIREVYRISEDAMLTIRGYLCFPDLTLDPHTIDPEVDPEGARAAILATFDSNREVVDWE